MEGWTSKDLIKHFLSKIGYLDNAIFQPSKMKVVLNIQFNLGEDSSKKMEFAQGMAEITSGRKNFKRRTGIWLFTDTKTGKFAWSKINSNGEKYDLYEF